MASLTSLVEKGMGRNFIIFHFSPASEVAFAHAPKIALQSKAKLDLMHVERSLRPEKPYWLDFPAVRATLTRWGILPEGVRRQGAEIIADALGGELDVVLVHKLGGTWAA
jgi:hypothetical protein